ncbi:hypothetical protein [Cryptosporangium sp. NPDC051539]|uniref:hypothetical protein n=1 Tax=Cryptosporangium sp. NPDC051539 TaxID=3363962 RepID=UPI0037981C20
MRIRILLLPVAAALVLAGCSTGSTDDPAPSVAPTTTGTTASATATSGSGGDVDPAALCAYLKGALPGWKAVGSEVGALAQATSDIADWYDKNSKSGIPDRDAMEAGTKAECPETRAEVLKTIGVDSFLNL